VKGELRALHRFSVWLDRIATGENSKRGHAACTALEMLDEYRAEVERECDACRAGDPYHWLGHPGFGLEAKP